MPTRSRLWIGLAGVAAAGLTLLVTVGCTRDDRSLDEIWADLELEGDGRVFTSELVEGLPEPARRFFAWSIAPGTPLARSVSLGMEGEIFLAPDRDPLPIQADQILAPPHGFIWRAQAGDGFMRINGFDRYAAGEGEMRWKLWGLIPVMRSTGEDVTRSAAGRLAMEAVLLPSALLTQEGVEWEDAGEDRARFIIRVGQETVEATLEVDPEGRPVRVSAQRWSEEAGPGYDEFAVEMTGSFTSGGYTIPSAIEAGWRLGSDDEFRFFRAALDRAEFR